MDNQSFRELTALYRGRMIANKYRILAGLGHGRSTAVFLGVEPLLKRLVALKRMVIERSAMERVIREIHGLSVLAGKPNIINYFGYEIEQFDQGETIGVEPDMEDPVLFFIAMEYGGPTLEEYLRHFGAETLGVDPGGADSFQFQAQALIFTRDVLIGLHAPHKEKIIHRDIHPANIYISTDGSAKIGGFGLAEPALQGGFATAPIAERTLYMAPEQVSGGRYGPNVDIFSAGVIMYRMITGRLPFETFEEVRTKQADLSIPEVSAMTLRILEKSLRKDPRDRYLMPSEMFRDVLQAVAELEERRKGYIGTERERIPLNAQAILDKEILINVRAAESGRFEMLIEPEQEPESTPAAEKDESAQVESEPDEAAGKGEEEAEDLDATSFGEAAGLAAGKRAKAPPEGERTMRLAPPRWILLLFAGFILVAVALVLYLQRYGTLSIHCDRPAAVSIDGKFAGTIQGDEPLASWVNLRVGHTVVCELEGFQTVERNLASGRDLLFVKMAPEVPPPVLPAMEVSLNLPDAVITLDGERLQGAPQESEGRFVWVFSDLPPGPRTVCASAPGSYFEEESEKVELKEGETARLTLDILKRKPSRLFLFPVDADGTRIEQFKVLVNGEAATIDADGCLEGEFFMGQDLSVEVLAQGFIPCRQTVRPENAEERLSPKLAPVEEEAPLRASIRSREPETPEVPLGRAVKVKSFRGRSVFINGAECRTPIAGCAIPETGEVQILAINYDAKTAWEKIYDAQSIPDEVTPEMAVCIRDVKLVSEPAPAEITMWNHWGRRVQIPASPGEDRALTPKRVQNLPCGVYKVRFVNREEGIDATLWRKIGPDSPISIVIRGR